MRETVGPQTHWPQPGVAFVPQRGRKIEEIATGAASTKAHRGVELSSATRPPRRPSGTVKLEHVRVKIEPLDDVFERVVRGRWGTTTEPTCRTAVDSCGCQGVKSTCHRLVMHCKALCFVVWHVFRITSCISTLQGSRLVRAASDGIGLNACCCCTMHARSLRCTPGAGSCSWHCGCGKH